LFVFFSGNAYAQRFSFGGFSGINFSNVHGNLTSNKWLSKPGPSAGILVEYRLSKLFSLQSEVNFLQNYYEMKTYESYSPGPIYFTENALSSSFCYIPVPSPRQYHWDFSFLRFPLLIKYYTPTRLQLGLGGGMFYSFLLNDDLSKQEREDAEKENRDIYPPTYDWGYLFSADLSYPVTESLRLFVNGRISTGRKVFIENQHGRNGASEFSFGMKYTPPQNKQNKRSITKIDYHGTADSLPSKVYLKPQVGIACSWNAGQKNGHYNEVLGSSTGIIIGYRLDRTVSVQSGVRFMRKGYALADSSIYNHRYGYRATTRSNEVDTKILLDYLTVPLNLNLSFGNRYAFYLDLGTYAGFLVNASCRGTVIRTYPTEYAYQVERIKLNDAVEGYYKSVDWGYLAGAGIQFPLRNSMKFDLGIHYSGSISKILEKPEQNGSYATKEDLSIKNGSIALQFGLQIPIHD
jgi:opacity protein-like surface antigen